MDEKTTRNRLAGLLVLVVEDDKFIADLLRKRLENEGMQVIYADTGEQALSTLGGQTPSLFIIDILLPSSDGFALLKEIRKIERLKTTPVILLSNLQSADVSKKIKASANTTMLLKSNFNLDEIVGEIEKIVSKQSRA